MSSFESMPMMENQDKENVLENRSEQSTAKDTESDESRHEREASEIHEELVQLSESANDFEERIIEESKSKPDRDNAILVGKIRDLAYRLSRSIAFQAIVLGAGVIETGNLAYDLFGDRLHGRGNADIEETGSQHAAGHEKEHIITYGSQKYQEKLNNLKQRLTAAGIMTPPSSSEDSDAFWKVLDHSPEDAHAIEGSINGHNEPIYNKYHDTENTSLADARMTKEKTRIPDEKFSAILAKMNYTHLLETSSRRFGIDPLKRVGYHRYENFNRDVLEVTQLMNERIKKLAQNGTYYPPSPPALFRPLPFRRDLHESLTMRVIVLL